MNRAGTDKPEDAWGENIQRFHLRWPAEPVVRFLCKTFPLPARPHAKVLEIGCGSGRNIVAAATEGFESYAVEYGAPSVRLAQQLATESGATVGLAQGDALALPFDANSFDAAIAWGVFFVLGGKTASALAEAQRVLKPGAALFSNWRTKEDHFYGMGEAQGDDTYLLDSRCEPFGLMGQTYSFHDRDSLCSLHEGAGLKIANIERQDTWINDLEVRNSWWQVWALKP
jgi:tRNA (uracil-5-)-methyltransferase TRM9